MGLRNHRGKWQVRFQVGGVPVTHNTGLAAVPSNRNGALRIEAELRLAQRTGKRLIRPIPFNEAVDAYLEWARQELKGSTWLAHRVSLAAWKIYVEEQLGGRAVGEITPGDVENFKSWRRAAAIAPNTLHNNLCVASKAWRWFLRQGWCVDNPIREVERPSKVNVRDFRVLTGEDEAAYLREAERRSIALHDLASVILDTGMRPEEVLALRVEDVDLLERVAAVRRGKSAAARRRLWLTDRVLEIMKSRLAAAGEDGWLWPSPRYEGAPMTKLNGPHDKVMVALGASWTIYDFRHTFATRCAESGMDIATLAAILGHSSLRVVMRYVHPTPRHQVEQMKAAMRKVRAKVRQVATSGPTFGSQMGQRSAHIRPQIAQVSANENGGNTVESKEIGGAGRN